MHTLQNIGRKQNYAHNTRPYPIDKVQHIVNRNVLNLYHGIIKIDSPARSVMQCSLARYITYGTTVPKCVLFYKVYAI